MKVKLTEEQQYRRDVFAYIDRLPECVIHLDKLCKKENRDKFLSVVKMYIERGVYNGYETKLEGDVIVKTDFLLPLQKKMYNENMPLV